MYCAHPHVRTGVIWVDLESRLIGGRCRVCGDERAAKHICVKENVHPQLDDLRQSCAGMQNVLTSTAQEERARLERHSLMPQYALDDQLYVVFITQLGFMLKMPMPEARLPLRCHVTSQRAGASTATPARDGLA